MYIYLYKRSRWISFVRSSTCRRKDLHHLKPIYPYIYTFSPFPFDYLRWNRGPHWSLVFFSCLRFEEEFPRRRSRRTNAQKNTRNFGPKSRMRIAKESFLIKLPSRRFIAYSPDKIKWPRRGIDGHSPTTSLIYSPAPSVASARQLTSRPPLLKTEK